MQVILLERVHNLGVLGETVNVKPGYARNFLLPKGKAISATVANLKKFEARRAELERVAAEAHAHAQQRATALTDVVVTIAAKAGDEGKLFGSITVKDLVAALAGLGHAIEKTEIRLPPEPIRQIGEYEVSVHLHSDVKTAVKLVVVAE